MIYHNSLRLSATKSPVSITELKENSNGHNNSKLHTPLSKLNLSLDISTNLFYNISEKFYFSAIIRRIRDEY